MGHPDVIRRAELLARHAHDGQVDKAGQPYASHPAAVAAITEAKYPQDVDAIATSWLHDVVEDTDVTIEEIRDQFGDVIAAAVAAITRHAGEDPDEYYRRVAADPIALRVKRSDLAHNCDPARLSALPAETQHRLQEKYRHAAAVLDELAGV